MSWNADPDSYYFIIAVDEGIPAIQVCCPILSGNWHPIGSVLNMTIFSRTGLFSKLMRYNFNLSSGIPPVFLLTCFFSLLDLFLCTGWWPTCQEIRWPSLNYRYPVLIFDNGTWIQITNFLSVRPMRWLTSDQNIVISFHLQLKFLIYWVVLFIPHTTYHIRTFVWRKIEPKFFFVEKKMTNMRSV